MHAWVKGVLVTLAAATILVASGATTEASAAGPERSTTLRAGATATNTAQIARTVYRHLSRKPASRDRVWRIRRLPARLAAPVVKRSVTDRNRDGRDDDGRVAFSIGQRNTSCLTLATGAVTRGNCKRSASTPRGIRQAPALLHRTVVWFDRNHRTYRMQPRDTAMLRKAVRELPSGIAVTFADADADAQVDDGQVMLHHAASRTCMVVYLPEHDPRGRTYDSAAYETTCP